MSRYKEKVTEVTRTETTYYRPAKVTFFTPEDHEVLVEVQEAVIKRQNGEFVDANFSRTLSAKMTAENMNDTFEVTSRQGKSQGVISYKQLFFAVESFYKHLAELEDE